MELPEPGVYSSVQTGYVRCDHPNQILKNGSRKDA